MKELNKLLHDIRLSYQLFMAIFKFYRIDKNFSNLKLFEDTVVNFWFNFYIIISTYVAVNIDVKGKEIAGASIAMFDKYFKELYKNRREG